MKKALMLSCVSIAFYASCCIAAQSESCSITCYEKTPTCYVTKDKSGCLIIANEKPACRKGSITCSSPRSNSKTTYTFEKNKQATVVTRTQE